MINKILIYLSLFFIFFDSFPFERMHLGSNKPLSLVFLIIYFILNIKYIINDKKYRIEKLAFIFLFFLIIVSFIKGLIFYENIENAVRFLNENISLLIVYLSIKDILIRNKMKLMSIINSIFYGYCLNNVFGIIQLIYIKNGSSILLGINKLLLVNTNHLENGRVQFLFGEPSFIGTHILLMIVPLILLCKYKNIRISKFIKLNIIIMLILSFYSMSLRFTIDLIVGISLIILIHNRKKITKISFLAISISIIMFFGIPQILENYSDNLLVMRINNILNKDSGIVDHSVWARRDYSLVGIESLKKKPILGYGGGYYNQAYRENIFDVDNNYAGNMELLRNYEAEYLNSINMYMRFFSEFGIIGSIALFMFVIALLKKANIDLLKSIVVLILYNWIQNDSFVLLNIIFWLAFIINTKLIIEGGSEKAI